MDKETEAALELLRKAGKIFCPYCFEEQDEDAIMQHVTYWGEPNQESDEEETCTKCNKKFIVKESVTRVFSSVKIEDEGNDD